MANTAGPNTSSISTIHRWHLAKIDAPPRGTSTGGRAAPADRKRRPRLFWRRGQVLITYKGGPEASYLFQMNGRTWRFTGHDCLHDVMTHAAKVLL